MNCSERNLIVIVDNDSASVNYIKALVKRLGLESKAFYFSTDAKNFLLGEGRGMVSVLISDVEMPTISGIQLTAAVKEQTDIKVICVSGASITEAECRKAGCDFFFVKPLELTNLQEALRGIS